MSVGKPIEVRHASEELPRELLEEYVADGVDLWCSYSARAVFKPESRATELLVSALDLFWISNPIICIAICEQIRKLVYIINPRSTRISL